MVVVVNDNVELEMIELIVVLSIIEIVVIFVVDMIIVVVGIIWEQSDPVNSGLHKQTHEIVALTHVPLFLQSGVQQSKKIVI